MGGSTYSKPLPNINQDTRFDKEKASNLFTAMEKAIAQEQAKQGPDRLNAIDRQWESKRRPLVQNTKKKEESESSDSFELDGDTGAFTGVYTQSKANNKNNKDHDNDSDDEFGIVDNAANSKFKKLDKNNLLAFVNDPNITSEERREYQKRLNEFKNKKNDFKKKNNIKGTVIVENDEEGEDDDEDEESEVHQNKGKISEIFDDTMGEYNKQQKELQRLQKEKEAAALAKLDILKAEQSKNKVISSVGKGLVSNNLASKAKSIAQNKEYDANKLLQEEIKSSDQKIVAGIGNSSNSEFTIQRQKIMINGKPVGCLNFIQSAKKIELKLENIYLRGVNINALKQVMEEVKVAAPQLSIIEVPKLALNNLNAQQFTNEKSPQEEQPVFAQSNQDLYNPNNYAEEDPMNKWLQVNKEREEEIQQKLNKNYDAVDEVPVKIIRYLDAWMYFLTEDYSKYLDDIVRETDSSGGVFSFLKKKTKLNKSLNEERDIFLCLAKLKMDTSIDAHERILFSIYMQLTGDDRCGRTGQHWIDIGFQNEDPQTDIRGSGILGLIQLLYFTEVYNELACRYLNHSQMPDSKFPFSVKCFEFTTLTLKILRSGKIFKLCNDKGNVDIVCNDLYSAAIWLFMCRYIQTESNIRHMNDLNNQVFDYVEKNPVLVIQQFKDYIESQKEKEDKYQMQEFPDYNIQHNMDEDGENNGENEKPSGNLGRINKYAM